MAGQISLEAFEQTLRNRRSIWILPQASNGFPPGFQEMILQENPAFQRKVLLCTKHTSDVLRYTEQWDSILTVVTGQDWSLALTHILYQPKPTLVVVAPELITPPQVYQKLNTTPRSITFVQFVPMRQQQFDRTFLTADCILFPPTLGTNEDEIETLYGILQQIQQGQTKQTFREILRDTRTAGASILFSSIDEPQGRQCMYWYYATSQQKSPKVDAIITLFQSLLQRIL